MFVGPRMESVTDASGMHLYDSGAHSFVTYFSHRFNAAGTYTYHSTTGAPMVGTVSVPIQLAPSTGSQTTTFTVTCSAGVTPSGFGYDIQVRRPGSSSYVDWKIGATKRAVAFVPDGGKGTYSFRSRLVKLSDGTHTDWSPAGSISVS